MSFAGRVRERHILLMQRTVKILGNILAPVPQHQAATLRDGDDGWTVLEIVCHLRDFNAIFFERAQLMVNVDDPRLPAYDHEVMAVQRKYNEQNLQVAYRELNKTREEFVTFFQNLKFEQWERAGLHPVHGHYTLTDQLMQVGHHDTNHIEQITRVLQQA